MKPSTFRPFLLFLGRNPQKLQIKLHHMHQFYSSFFGSSVWIALDLEVEEVDGLLDSDDKPIRCRVCRL
ncbi:unnamed protein product [Amaranthus hypochondriacus]